MTRGIKAGFSLISMTLSVSMVCAQGWSLEELKTRTQSQAERLSEMREAVFLRYGAELGYERAEDVPIMDREYERLSREVTRLETELSQDRDEKDRADQQAALRAAEAERAARAREIARQRAEQRARELSEIEAPFREALTLYRQKAYQPSYDRFIKLYFERQESVLVAFYTGRTAFETRRYEIAAGAYQQVLTVEPDHRRAQLELARTYYVMGMHQEARRHFLAVQDSDDIPPEVRQNIQAYLDAIEAAQKRHHLTGQLIAGLAHDTNVNQGSDYIDPTLGTDNPAKSDTIVSLVSFNAHRYDFGAPGGWQWESEALLFANKHSSLGGNDLFLLGLKTGPLGDLGVGRLRLPVGYDMVWVDGDALLNILTVGIGLERALSPQQFAKASFKWLDKGYKASENSDKGTTGYELGMDWQYVPAPQNQIFNLAVAYTAEERKQGERPDTDFTALSLRGHYTQILGDWNLGGGLQLKKIEYSDPFVLTDQVTRVKREDTQTTLTLSAGKTLRPMLTGSGQLSWSDNDSSHGAYSYDKTVAQFNLSWGWGI